MSRIFYLLLPGLLLASVPPAAAAQSPVDSVAILTRRLARVDSQLGQRLAERREEARRSAPSRRGRVQHEGRLTLVVHEATPRVYVTRIAAAADSVLRALGYLTDDQIAQPILVTENLSDTAALLAGPRYQGRPRLSMDWRTPGDTSFDNGWRVLRPLSRYMVGTLEEEWRVFLTGDFVLWAWDPADQVESVLNELASEGATATGRECLAGMIGSCRLWLGFDRDSVPYENRYRPEELVASVQFWNSRNAELAPCRQGDIPACLRMFHQVRAIVPLSPIPAPAATRASLLLVLRERRGAEAVQRVLADTTGSIGERLARAADLSVDSLTSEWRMWVLSRGRSDRVQAGAGELISALLFVGLLVALATRSGRWR